MAQVEFTQQFSVPYLSDVASYVQLQTVAGVYVIKGLTCYSTVGIAPGVGAGASLTIINATNGSGGGLQYIFSLTDTVAANILIPIANPAQQFILTESYLGFIAVGSPGNLVINITYSFIPSTNVLSANFSNEYRNVVNTTGATFTGSSATVPCLIKSLSFINPTNTSSVSITPFLTVGATTLAFDQARTLDPGSSYIYPYPIAVTSAETISVQSVGGASVYVLYSYTQEN